MPTNQGDADGAEPSIRFAFDTDSRKCKPFMFSGKGGNANSFINAQLCLNFCSSAGF
jgi:hypothetical protein